MKQIDELNRIQNEIPQKAGMKSVVMQQTNVTFRSPSTVPAVLRKPSGEDMVNYFLKVKDYLTERKLERLLSDPSAWGCCREAEIDLSSIPPKVLSGKGKKNKERASVLYTFVGNGLRMKPQLNLSGPLSRITDSSEGKVV
jgi:hypothetical protein